MNVHQPSTPAGSFATEGFIGPLHLLTPAQCALVMRHVQLGPTRKMEWAKGRAAVDRFFWDLAMRPSITELLNPLLGPDIILWGATVVRRMPGQVHAWHSDMESASPDGGFVSVWIGIENTSRESSMQLMSGSHRMGKPVQQIQFEKGRSREETTDADVLAWGREHDPATAFIELDMSDGDAVIFDGRLWHSSHNRSADARTAFLLQYAAAGVPVRRPLNEGAWDWPFRFQSESQPPVLAVSGTPRPDVNRVVPPPSLLTDDSKDIVSEAIPLDFPLAEGASGFRPYHLFRGPTTVHDEMESHVSVLNPGRSPHPPHVHIEEEILIVLDGEAEVLIGDPDPESCAVHRFPKGSMVYYPAYRYHTIRNAGDKPITYLMFKWRGPPVEVATPMPTSTFPVADTRSDVRGRPGATVRSKRTFEQPTGFLGKLHAHVTEIDPDGGYAEHRDSHDVAIVLFSGTVRTVGKTVNAPGVIYYSAGVSHGMENVGSESARYLVFEFHPFDKPSDAAAALRPRPQPRPQVRGPKPETVAATPAPPAAADAKPAAPASVSGPSSNIDRNALARQDLLRIARLMRQAERMRRIVRKERRQSRQNHERGRRNFWRKLGRRMPAPLRRLLGRDRRPRPGARSP